MQSNDLSRRFVEVIPQAMQAIRVGMRESAKNDFTVPQYRVLGYIGRHGITSNNDLASFMGVTAPTMSRLVESLARKKMVVRTTSKTDRRGIHLSLSPKGKVKYEEYRSATKARFQSRFESLSAEKREALKQAVELMEELFK